VLRREARDKRCVSIAAALSWRYSHFAQCGSSGFAPTASITTTVPLLYQIAAFASCWDISASLLDLVTSDEDIEPSVVAPSKGATIAIS
jgi:hypothetical protein